MAKFNFDLENVLKVKKIRENQAKASLLSLQKHYQEEENVLKKMEEDYLYYQRDLSEKKQTACELAELKLYADYFQKALLDIAQQKDVLSELEQKVSRQRDELVTKVKERKILENLKEKKYLQFKKELLHKEQNFLDEIATNKYARPSEY